MLMKELKKRFTRKKKRIKLAYTRLWGDRFRTAGREGDGMEPKCVPGGRSSPPLSRRKPRVGRRRSPKRPVVAGRKERPARERQGAGGVGWVNGWKEREKCSKDNGETGELFKSVFFTVYKQLGTFLEERWNFQGRKNGLAWELLAPYLKRMSFWTSTRSSKLNFDYLFL